MYRLKHKPTGLYYQPARGRVWSKCNLSQTGKVYARKPQIPESIQLSVGSGKSARDKILLANFRFEKKDWHTHASVNTPSTEWEIVEINI